MIDVLVVLVVPQAVGDLLRAPRAPCARSSVVADVDVEHGAGPVLALVADPQDLAVADVPDGAVDVADAGHAQADVLDGADRLAEVDLVAHAVLVLDHHHHAGEEVLDEVLGAEADGQTEDTGAGQDRARR